LLACCLLFACSALLEEEEIRVGLPTPGSVAKKAKPSVEEEDAEDAAAASVTTAARTPRGRRGRKSVGAAASAASEAAQLSGRKRALDGTAAATRASVSKTRQETTYKVVTSSVSSAVGLKEDADEVEEEEEEENPAEADGSFEAADEEALMGMHVDPSKVTVVNRSRVEVDVSGWSLRAVVAGGSFSFPAGTRVAPGGSLTVWAGPDAHAKAAAAAAAGSVDLVWSTASVWDPAGDTASLRDPAGREISSVHGHPVAGGAGAHGGAESGGSGCSVM